MLLLLLKLFILIYPISFALGITNRDVATAIGKFILLENKPTQISTHLCWPANDIIYLTKVLNGNGITLTANNYAAALLRNQSLPKFHPAEHQLYLIDLKCMRSMEIINMAQLDGLLKFPYRWIMIADVGYKLAPKYDISINSRVYLMEIDEMYLTIKSIYKIGKNDVHFNENCIGSFWGNDFRFYNRIIDHQNRSDLMGMDMNISIVHIYKDTLNHLDDMKHNNIDAITKHNYLLIKHIVEILNITPHYRFHGTWGYANPNTSIYNGEIGDLQLGISEIGGTAAFLTQERFSVIEYASPTTPTYAKFVFRSPPLSVVANILTLPFDIWVWYASFAILFIIFVVVYAIAKWEWSDKLFRSTAKNRNEKYDVLYPNVLDVIQMQIGAICQQGAEAEPKSLAGRIATFSIFLALMFIYVSYSANIVALLQATSDSIQTVDDLLNSRIELGAEETPYSRYYFEKQTEKTRKLIYKKKIAPRNKPHNFMNVQTGVRKIKEDFFAFHSECDTMYKVMSNTFLESEKCGIKEIDVWNIPAPYVPIRKHSAYAELIKVGYAKIFERGIKSRSFRRMYTKRPACQHQGVNFMSVSLRDCYFAPLTFGIGILIAMCILALEVLYGSYLRKFHKHE